MKKIKGFDNYAVTYCGMVINTKSNRFLKLKPDRHTGYPYITLYRGGKQVSLRVHRIVYEAFSGEIPSGLVINHIDGDKTNNKRDNLELVSPSENSRHAIAIGLRKSLKKVYSRDQFNTEEEFESAASAGRFYGISPQTVRRIIGYNRVFQGKIFYYKK